VSELAERLGYGNDARILIISCDDLGSCHAANLGVLSAMREGAATCASIMVPAPWARHATDLLDASDDIGVHLTLNAEHGAYRWGPITHAPSLLSGEGGFPRNTADLWEHADLDEVRRELRAQVNRAIAWGVDVTHLAPHLSAITLRPEFFDIYIDLAVEFSLPIRLPSTITEAEAGFPYRRLAAEEAVVFPDHFDHDWRPGSRDRILNSIASLEPGVTEIHIQPAVDTPEVRALTDFADGWIDDHRVAVDGTLSEAVRESGAVLIGYRDLRELMRSA
jgi:predicted glycoside hydrolase/deacetylase ChbG (UPF0249 family)